MSPSQSSSSTYRPPVKIRWGMLFFAFLGLWSVVLAIRVNSSASSDRPQSTQIGVEQHAAISRGEELLIEPVSSDVKRLGIQAFAQGNYLKSIQQLQHTLIENPNDPESRIYLNNAKLNFSGQQRLRIAVSVPAGNNPTIAQEMLRGIAQAQTSINELGIYGAGLELVIVNDNNDAEQAKAMAQKVLAAPEVLAVVGSNASGPSLAAASLYRGGMVGDERYGDPIVMISPTSFTGELSNYGHYIFRTIPSMKSLAEALAIHALEVKKQPKMAICYDSEAIDNVSFKDDFIKAYQARGGQIIDIDCDLSTLKTTALLSKLKEIQKQTNALMIAPHIDRQKDAIALIQATRGKMQLFSTPTLYTSTILTQADQGLENMVLAAPWYAERYSATSFLARAEQRWGESAITWRTAASFDALQAIAQGLRSIPPDQPLTRRNLQAQLRSAEFVAAGAGESVRFLPSGDRAGRAILVQVQPGSQQKYEFAAVAR